MANKILLDWYGGDDLAADVLEKKYLAPSETRPEAMWNRVAQAIASVEREKDRVTYQDKFYHLLKDWRFIPGGRIMHGAGREDANRKPTLSNCYVIPVLEDSIEGIYQCLAESAQVYRTGGGVGTDLSILRPKGAPVNATIDKSPGVTAFMNLFSESTNAISQAGRRGALMLTLRVDHPDIEDFIRIKSDANRTKVQHANVSVLLTDEFMKAVEDDTDFELHHGGTVYNIVKAKELWHLIIKHAHASAEPGLIFWDRMKAYHNVEYAAPLSSTNPCAEQPLANYTACNLGNLNLSKYVRDGRWDMPTLLSDVHTAVRFLDNVITYNQDNHALDQIKYSVDADRRVGLGITGLADALVRKGIKYDSDEALRTVDFVMNEIRNEAYRQSVQLAKERGAFPLFDKKKIKQSEFYKSLPDSIRHAIQKHGLRNSTLLTCPPVGTGSIVGQCSSGIEPIFCTSYNRRVKQADGETFEDYKVYHPLIKELYGDDSDLPEHVVVAHDIDPFFRVKMQGIIQGYVDTSISSTINLAQDVSVETVSSIYIEAYKQGLKGVTVYREGSREGILQTEDFADSDSEKESEKESEKGLLPRERPAITHGTTEKIVTGYGNLYVTVNEDAKGIAEVFATLGKSGSDTHAQTQALCRVISLALRSGVAVDEIVKTLKGIAGSRPVWSDGVQYLSMPDAIAKSIERYSAQKYAMGELLKRAERIGKDDDGDDGVDIDYIFPGASTLPHAEECPDCGEMALFSENGCKVCKSCGYSECS